MCIISGETNRVSKTKILAIPATKGSRQLTVYMNSVDTPATNLMILPVPYPQTVTFEKVPADLFDECERSFATPLSYGDALPDGLIMVSRPDSSVQLEVQEHGSYNVVVVPSIDHLEQVPEEFAILTEEVKEFLRANYAKPFGFLLCLLRAGAVSYEPFAYSHKCVKSQLFIPTMHYHPRAHTQKDYDRTLYTTGQPFDESRYTADWDHAIYTLGTTDEMQSGHHKRPLHLNMISWNKMPPAFRWGPDHALRLRKIVGPYANRDLYADFTPAYKQFISNSEQIPDPPIVASAPSIVTPTPVVEPGSRGCIVC